MKLLFFFIAINLNSNYRNSFYKLSPVLINFFYFDLFDAYYMLVCTTLVWTISSNNDLSWHALNMVIKSITSVYKMFLMCKMFVLFS